MTRPGRATLSSGPAGTILPALGRPLRINAHGASVTPKLGFSAYCKPAAWRAPTPAARGGARRLTHQNCRQRAFRRLWMTKLAMSRPSCIETERRLCRNNKKFRMRLYSRPICRLSGQYATPKRFNRYPENAIRRSEQGSSGWSRTGCCPFGLRSSRIKPEEGKRDEKGQRAGCSGSPLCVVGPNHDTCPGRLTPREWDTVDQVELGAAHRISGRDWPHEWQCQ